MNKLFSKLDFKRVASSKIIEELDGLRFIAILMVFLIHLKGIWLRYTVNSYTNSFSDEIFMKTIGVLCQSGVQLFFVISGFILALPWMNAYHKKIETPNIKKFYLRRLTRLEPPYILLSVFLLFFIVIYKNVSFSEIMPHFWASIFYVHNFIFGYGSKINVAAWSLEIEIQFYLLVPLLIPFIHKVLRQSIWLIALFTFLYPIILFLFIPHSHTGLHQFLHYFLVGILWSYIYINTEFLKIKKIKYDLILFGSLVFVLLLFFDTFDFLPIFALNFLKNNVIVWLIYLFFLVCFKGEMFNKFLKIPFVSIVGSMCYSIYLTHGFIITMLIMLFKNIIDTGSFVGDFIILFCIVSPITLIFCSIFYLIFERPFMKHDWPNRILSFFCSASKSNA